MKQKPGFTIVELLVVIVVIAILAVISIVAYNGIADRARHTKVKAELSQLRKGAQLLTADTNKRPFGCPNDGIASDPEGSIAHPRAGMLTLPPIGPFYDCEWTQIDINQWNGPYFTHATDPWGRPYMYDNDYVVCINGRPKEVIAALSAGPNGVINYPTTASPSSSTCTETPTDDIYEILYEAMP